MKNNNASFFSIWGGHLRGRYQEVMQAASQELAAQGAMDQQRIQVLMKMLEMEQKKLGVLKKAKLDLGKAMLKETGGGLSESSILGHMISLEAISSNEQKKADATSQRIEEQVRKEYTPTAKDVKRMNDATGAATLALNNNPAGADITAKIVTWKNKELVAGFGAKTQTFMDNLEPTLVGSAIMAKRYVNEVVSASAVPSTDPEIEDIIGGAVFGPKWENYKKMVPEEELETAIVNESKVRQRRNISPRLHHQTEIKKRLDEHTKALNKTNPEAAKILKDMMEPSPDMLAVQAEIARLKGEVESKMKGLEAPTYEKVATRAGEIILGEEDRRDARETMEKKVRVGVAEGLLGMPDDEADYYRSLQNARKYFNESDKDLAGRKGNPSRFVNAILKSKDKSWKNFNTQAKAKLSPEELQDAQALYASRIYRSGKEAMGSQDQKMNMAKSVLKPKPYKVLAGDTLSALAVTHGTTVAYIKKINKLDSDKITVGQELVFK